MYSALQKIKNTFVFMSKRDIESFLSASDLSDFDKKVVRLKASGRDTSSVMVLLNCSQKELFDSYERIVKQLQT